MEHDLLYELEYEVNEVRKSRLYDIKYNALTIKDFLDLGFNDSFILINGNWFNLGYKWYVDDNYGYESSDFGELNENQLNCMVKYVDDEISEYNYLEVSVVLVNDDDGKYF